MTVKILRVDHTTNTVRVIPFANEQAARAFLCTLQEGAAEVGGSYTWTDNADADGLVTRSADGTVVIEYLWSTFDRPKCFTTDALASDEQEDVAKPVYATKQQLRRVRERYMSEDIAVDDDARVSEAAEGDWIAAWLWLPEKEED